MADELAKPITLCDWEVQALLDGCKTQLRRLMEPQPVWGTWQAGHVRWDVNSKGMWCANDYRYWDGIGQWGEWRCPYPVGTLLWVRETWKCVGEDDGSEYPIRCVVYRADAASREFNADFRTDIIVQFRNVRWRSLVVMPRWASRLCLRVKGVRVERVQEISYDDALAEGCDKDNPLARFVIAWDHYNLKRGYGWGKNPWVWVYELRGEMMDDRRYKDAVIRHFKDGSADRDGDWELLGRLFFEASENGEEGLEEFDKRILSPTEFAEIYDWPEGR